MPCDWCTKEKGLVYTLCGELRLCEVCEKRHYSKCIECQEQDLENMAYEYYDTMYDEEYE